MAVKLLYFARLREALGVSVESLELPTGVQDVGGLMAWLAARGGVWQEQFDGCRQIRAAVNQELVADDASIQAGDEVAFFPPVTGG
jgi:molybdopterin synthase sulfur carrier subunit